MYCIIIVDTVLLNRVQGISQNIFGNVFQYEIAKELSEKIGFYNKRHWLRLQSSFCFKSLIDLAEGAMVFKSCSCPCRVRFGK